jgi:hypothetical protein
MLLVALDCVAALIFAHLGIMLGFWIMVIIGALNARLSFIFTDESDEGFRSPKSDGGGGGS